MTNVNGWDTSPQSNPWANQETIERPSWLTEDLEKALINNNLQLNQDGMLMLWQNAKDQLNHWKEREMEYRKVAAVMLVPAKTEGTTNVPLGNDWNAKVVNKYNYKLDSDNDKVWSGLDKLSLLDNEGKGKAIAERLVSWTPNFLLTEYRQLQEDAEKGDAFAKRALNTIAEFMTISDAAPTLEVAEKKKRK